MLVSQNTDEYYQAFFGSGELVFVWYQKFEVTLGLELTGGGEGAFRGLETSFRMGDSTR